MSYLNNPKHWRDHERKADQFSYDEYGARKTWKSAAAVKAVKGRHQPQASGAPARTLGTQVREVD